MTMVVVLFPFSPNLHGGKYPRRDVSLWQMYQYKYTELLRREPLCWCPFKAYTIVDNNVTVENRNNYNWLIIETDLIARTAPDAQYNKVHAPKYKGKTRDKVKKIYKYCYHTKYKLHAKTARDVFQYRKADCAGIAEAFYVLCKKNGIPVRYVIGWCDGECHAWNRVKIGKKWYWIDATLGDWLSRELYEDRTVLEIW